MIIIKAIKNDNDNYSPEYIPIIFYGCNFDGNNFIFFESIEESNNYYKTLD